MTRLTRQQRRHASRHGIPFDAEGNVITLTRADLELVNSAAETLNALLEALTREVGIGNDTETANMIRRDAALIQEVAQAAKESGLDDGLIVSRAALIPMKTILGCWARFSPAVDALLRGEGLQLDTHGATHALTGRRLPDAASMAALDAKLLRISDALRGEAGVSA